MDFDHRIPIQKRNNICKMLQLSEKLLLEEISKCDVVCANCHRIRTHNKLKKKPLNQLNSNQHRHRARKIEEIYNNLIIPIKNNPCSKCNKIFHYKEIDFNHIKGVKTDDVSSLIMKLKPISIILEEIAKCELVCANCHRLFTFNKQLLQIIN